MSSSNAILGSVVLGFCPMIDRQHQVGATRLTVIPRRPDARVDAHELIACLAQVWPEGGGTLLINAVSEPLVQDLLRALPPHNFRVEVPAFMATDAAQLDIITLLQKNGSKLIIKGRALAAVAPELQPSF
ncbi:MAG TPA: histidine kinase, partial [Burkholderiaceae bacterium]